MQCACLQQEQRRPHRSSEGASNDGSNEGDEDDESGQSQVLHGSDASDREVVDVVTGDEDDKDDGMKDEVWMSEKRHSGDGEVPVTA